MATTGKYLQVTASGVTLHKGIQKWNSDPTGEELDDTDAETNGYEDIDIGVRGVRITIEGIWDLADGPFPAIRRGDTLTDLRAFANRTQTTPDYYLPLARVMKRPRVAEIRGQIKYTLEVRSRGIFYEDGVAA